MRLLSAEQVARTRALRALLKQNTDGLLTSHSASFGGFDDRRSTPSSRVRVLCGMYKFLKSVTPKQLRRLAIKYALADDSPRLSILKSPSVQGHVVEQMHGSNTDNGELVHCQLFHTHSCTSKSALDNKQCRCAALFGSSTAAAVAAATAAPIDPTALQMTNSITAYLRSQQLRPLLAEQVIVADAPLNVGTRFDALMRRCTNGHTKDESVALVSYKSGGNYLFNGKSLLDVQQSYSKTNKTKATRWHNKVMLRRQRDIVQVMCEAAMLERTHGVLVDEAHIVYGLAARASASTPGSDKLALYHAVKVPRDVLATAPALLDELQKCSTLGQWDRVMASGAAAAATAASGGGTKARVASGSRVKKHGK